MEEQNSDARDCNSQSGQLITSTGATTISYRRTSWIVTDESALDHLLCCFVLLYNWLFGITGLLKTIHTSLRRVIFICNTDGSVTGMIVLLPIVAVPQASFDCGANTFSSVANHHYQLLGTLLRLFLLALWIIHLSPLFWWVQLLALSRTNAISCFLPELFSSYTPSIHSWTMVKTSQEIFVVL